MPAAGIALGVGSAVGGLTSMLGADKAASAEQNAANQQMAMFNQTRAGLQPYNTAGQSVLPALTSLATSGPYGGGPNYVSQAAGIGVGPGGQAALAQTPGYQFQLQQAQQALQSSAAARGLGVSGAEMKGAASYATGLASSNYQQQFANALALNTAQQGNLQNQFNRLTGTASLGEGAASDVGRLGTAAAGTAGGLTAQAGQANAAGIAGVGSALNQGAQNWLGYNAYQDYLNKLPGTTGGYIDQ